MLEKLAQSPRWRAKHSAQSKSETTVLAVPTADNLCIEDGPAIAVPAPMRAETKYNESWLSTYDIANKPAQQTTRPMGV